MARAVYLVSWAVTALCVAVLAIVVAFDTQAARYTAGRFPSEFTRRLTSSTRGDLARVVGVAHNAGDDVGQATKAAAYGADAVEIDVRAVGGELLASHDAPVPILEDLVFRGPPLSRAWRIASLRGGVLLHLKERNARYLGEVERFLHAHPTDHLTIQSATPATLQSLKAAVPSAERLLLISNPRQLQRLQSDPSLRAYIDGASVRDTLLTRPVQRWLEDHRLATFAWVVNDEQRVEDLAAEGVDGVITERLDLMHLLGTGRVLPR